MSTEALRDLQLEAAQAQTNDIQIQAIIKKLLAIECAVAVASEGMPWEYIQRRIDNAVKLYCAVYLQVSS